MTTFLKFYFRINFCLIIFLSSQNIHALQIGATSWPVTSYVGTVLSSGSTNNCEIEISRTPYDQDNIAMVEVRFILTEKNYSQIFRAFQHKPASMPNVEKYIFQAKGTGLVDNAKCLSWDSDCKSYNLELNYDENLSVISAKYSLEILDVKNKVMTSQSSEICLGLSKKL